MTPPKPTTPLEAWKILLGVLGTLAGVSIVVILLYIIVSYASVEPQVAGALTDEQRYDLLAKTKAEDQRLTTTYGWMDKPKAVVRIPVAQAMQKLLEEQPK